MRVRDIIDLWFVEDSTEIWIRKDGESGMAVLAHGNWYQDDVLKCMDCQAGSFTWQDDDVVYIDIK